MRERWGRRRRVGPSLWINATIDGLGATICSVVDRDWPVGCHRRALPLGRVSVIWHNDQTIACDPRLVLVTRTFEAVSVDCIRPGCGGRRNREKTHTLDLLTLTRDQQRDASRPWSRHAARTFTTRDAPTDPSSCLGARLGGRQRGIDAFQGQVRVTCAVCAQVMHVGFVLANPRRSVWRACAGRS